MVGAIISLVWILWAAYKPASRLMAAQNMALYIAPFSRWTLPDKAAQRRLALLV